MSFSDLGLSAKLLRAVTARGYTEPTPIQNQAIPAILAGRDVMAGAQTGTGKTAAFTLPLLQRLSQSGQQASARSPQPRALVLTPTRELAAQVGESVSAYGQYLPLRALQIFGGVGMGPQITALRRGVDILVATPGRLLDHVGQGNLDLGHVELLVLDEADRMLDMGFMPAIRRVLKLLPARRQNLLFSATYSRDIEQLATGLLNDPLRIEVARRNTAAETVRQLAHPVERGHKRALLSHLIASGGWDQTLVFTRTKHGANRLAQQLERDGISAAAIHGNKSQSARTRALADFKRGAVRTLVATDIAARGLDIERLPHVVNFELPNVAEDYVHRIGRTGRAGESGTAVSLVSPEEGSLLAGIERLLGRRIESQAIPGFSDRKATPASADDGADTRSRTKGSRPPRSASPNGGSARAHRQTLPGARGRKTSRASGPRAAR
ncbi:DEAD/DEAH box helicase [Thiorhodovibrio frisius]|uniref:DEAD-box ATP-dependent RNA helicase RhpA n=1 Tax=Thiorhodovibrio frisius TaxID=631362 RepID=H8Z6F1_9GAMM|nr:DEAD/DEAH box helicase [Thiorhodovibrio frisius]EIC20735.1 DNA/RNA helicase, superfamily II [Thiorhodovibrio frisius]WPL21483.1 ATP-dependent RNA helicase RhlE [Thiorhodovibrio frisius]